VRWILGLIIPLCAPPLLVGPGSRSVWEPLQQSLTAIVHPIFDVFDHFFLGAGGPASVKGQLREEPLRAQADEVRRRVRDYTETITARSSRAT